MNVGSTLKRTGIAAGVTAGVGGAVYAGQRALAARLRHQDDPDAESPLLPLFDEAIRIDCHDAGSLYVITRGEGRPVLFAHGVTLSSRVWAKQFDSFPAAGFRAVAFDGRGHGESTVGDSGHSIDNLAEDVRSVLEGLDLRDAVLVGHSMGGMAVQAFAIAHPDVVRARVSGIVLMSTAARALTSDARRVRSGLERMTSAVPNVGAIMRQRNFGLLVARMGFGDSPHPSHVEATRQMLAECSRETLRDASRAILSLDLTPGLPSIAVPTLVLVGTADVLTPPRDARQIASLIPGSELVEFTGAGHMLMYERAAAVDQLVIDFSRRQRVRDPGSERSRGNPMITDVPGVRVGHWTGDATGVTVIVFPHGTVASAEIRGGAPATRETALLEPQRTVQQVDAIVLAGGSAFGLAAADGVMRALAEAGRGLETRGGLVPLVPAAAIFDLVTSGGVVPGAEEGRAALADALQEPVSRSGTEPVPRSGTEPVPTLRIGRVGAGRGATVGKWRGGEYAVPGGLGSASARDGDVVVGALVVVNAVGDVLGEDGSVLAGSTAPDDAPFFPVPPLEDDAADDRQNTTLAVVATNARCTKIECRLLAESAHHGLVRAIHPSHTRHDGDITFAAATGEVDAHLDRLRLLVTEVTASAVRSAVA